MIKAIVFDIGGVFVEKKKFWKRIHQAYPEKSMQEIFAAREKDNARIKYRIGKFDQRDYARHIAKVLGVDYTHLLELAKLPQIWKPKVVAFAKKLSKEYRLAVLTNAGKSTRLAERKRKLGSIMEFIAASSEIRVAKPHREAYQTVLNKLKVEPKEVIFVDNREHNVNAAKKLGIKGIIFEDVRKLKKDLEKLGVSA